MKELLLLSYDNFGYSSNVHPLHELTVDKVMKIMKNSSQLIAVQKKHKRFYPSHAAKKDQCLSDVDKLFHMFCLDCIQRRESEEQRMLPMTEEDYKFYKDQKSKMSGL